MAKIVYGLSGEGSGHSSRSREMISHLISKGHIVKAASYDRGYRNLKDDFDVLEIVGLRMVNKDNKIARFKTLTENLSLVQGGVESSNILKQKLFKDFQPHVVITDFEPMTAYLANYFKIPLITIDNQHRMRYMDFDYPLEMKADAILVENLIRAMIPRPCVSLITTFYFGEVKNDRSFLVPPILRKAIIEAKPVKKEHILVYVTQSFEGLIDELKSYTREKFFLYGFDREQTEGNLIFKPFSREGFLEDLSTCKAVIATAGFTLMTESLYLGKPFLAFPVMGQFEQMLNGLMLNETKLGKSVKKLNRESISAFLYDLPEYEEELKNYERLGNTKIKAKLDELLEDDGKLLKEFHEKRQ